MHIYMFLFPSVIFFYDFFRFKRWSRRQDNSDATSGKKVQSRLPAGNRIPVQPWYLWESLRGEFNGESPSVRSLRPQEASPCGLRRHFSLFVGDVTVNGMRKPNGNNKHFLKRLQSEREFLQKYALNWPHVPQKRLLSMRLILMNAQKISFREEYKNIKEEYKNFIRNVDIFLYTVTRGNRDVIFLRSNIDSVCHITCHTLHISQWKETLA